MLPSARLVALLAKIGILPAALWATSATISADQSQPAPAISVQQKSVVSENGLFRWRYHIADSSFCYASACVDVDNDGQRDLFFASRATGAITRLNAADGAPIWSRRLPGSQQSISAFDLNGNGRPEILYTVSDPGRLYILDDRGNVLKQWDSGDGKLGNSPVIIDVDGDGVLDGFFGSRSRYLFRLNMHDVTVIHRRDAWSQCGCHTTAMDVDRNGHWDLFAGDGDDISKKGVLHRIDPLNLQSVWSLETNDNASSADPVLVDLNGDGKVEILKSIDNYGGDDAHDAVFAVSTDGQLLWKTDGLSGEDTPNVADLDGDGEVEIVGMTFDCEVYCLDARGNVKWRRDLRPELDRSAHAYMTPILCDLNGDAQLEILAITNGGYFDDRHQPGNQGNGILFALSHTGQILDQLDLGEPRFFGEAFVCQLDDDPYLALVLSGSGGLDVISLRGFGPHTEYFQRRRTYQRLNVMPWAYEDSYFLQRGTKDQVTNQTDNLVLVRKDGEYRRQGRFVTELLQLPPECEFRKLRIDVDIPDKTEFRIDVLDAQDRVLRASLGHEDDLKIREPIKLAFHFATNDPQQSPKLHSYSLAFDKTHPTPGRTYRTATAQPRAMVGSTISATANDDRFDARVFANLEINSTDLDSIRLVEITPDGEVHVASQVASGEPTRLWWIARGEWPAGSTRTFRIDPADAQPPPREMMVERNERFLEIRAGSSPVLRYHLAHREPPDGVDPAYGRSAFIHPVWTPGGFEVTDEFPPGNEHQSGIFLAYPKTRFEDREPNFWDLLGGTGRVRFKAVKSTTDGPVFAEFVVEHEHVDRTTSEEQVALLETWTVRAWNVGGGDAGYFMFDILSKLECAGTSPLQLPAYHYGGMAVRGGRRWTARQAKVVTSDGLDRLLGNHSRPRWSTLSGPVVGPDGNSRTAGITFCTHPDNFRFPEPLRIHPTTPYMVYTPQQLGEFDLVPGVPHISRYRFIPHDDELPAAVANRLWTEFAGPLQAR